MQVGDLGKVFNQQNLFSRVGDFGLEVDEAKAIFKDTKSKLQGWRSFYKKLNLSSLDLEYREGAFKH
jgi:hypothetical protein